MKNIFNGSQTHWKRMYAKANNSRKTAQNNTKQQLILIFKGIHIFVYE